MVLWPLLLFFLLVVGLLAAMLLLSGVLGETHKERATGELYESGMVPTGTTPSRFYVNFYLIGVLFVIFDLEAAFIITWSVAVRETGLLGYVEIVVFITVLSAALVYLWRMGALELSGDPK